MSKNTKLDELFTETLKDIYFAEKQILRALPKMAKEATSPELKEAFETHREEAENQVERLNQIFESMGRPRVYLKKNTSNPTKNNQKSYFSLAQIILLDPSGGDGEPGRAPEPDF